MTVLNGPKLMVSLLPKIKNNRDVWW